MAGHSPGEGHWKQWLKMMKRKCAERQKDLFMKSAGEAAPSGSGKNSSGNINYVPVPMLSESECLKCSFITGKSD